MTKKNVIMSLKAPYAAKIFDKTKRYEFRKSDMKLDEIGKVYVYETAPLKRITGYFTIKSKIIGTPNNIWNIVKRDGGISEKDFLDYFKNSAGKCYAYEIGEVVKFKKPFYPYDEIKGFRAPMSFSYTDIEIDFNHE